MQEINEVIIDAIQDIKGKNIIKLDLTKLDDAPAKYFIICEGESTTQVKAISERINQKVKENLFVKPNHTEGLDGSKWVLVDYFETIVHVFYPETRQFYDIEDLWGDAVTTEYSDN
ncbi:MAG: ribosome silencing factor [Saprospiraceae bacterium]|nr:ribosome silencing factor [Saprospiraceae bacterium]MCB9311033.1 ribosome silencing factor [Lewinellaceae bacterium]